MANHTATNHDTLSIISHVSAFGYIFRFTFQSLSNVSYSDECRTKKSFSVRLKHGSAFSCCSEVCSTNRLFTYINMYFMVLHIAIFICAVFTVFIVIGVIWMYLLCDICIVTQYAQRQEKVKSRICLHLQMLTALKCAIN